MCGGRVVCRLGLWLVLSSHVLASFVSNVSGSIMDPTNRFEQTSLGAFLSQDDWKQKVCCCYSSKVTVPGKSSIIEVSWCMWANEGNCQPDLMDSLSWLDYNKKEVWINDQMCTMKEENDSAFHNRANSDGMYQDKSHYLKITKLAINYCAVKIDYFRNKCSRDEFYTDGHKFPDLSKLYNALESHKRNGKTTFNYIKDVLMDNTLDLRPLRPVVPGSPNYVYGSPKEDVRLICFNKLLTGKDAHVHQVSSGTFDTNKCLTESKEELEPGSW